MMTTDIISNSERDKRQKTEREREIGERHTEQKQWKLLENGSVNN